MSAKPMISKWLSESDLDTIQQMVNEDCELLQRRARAMSA
jgi:hypothetical protein